MRFYDRQHRFYAGVDLHARTMHLCVLDATGTVVCDVNLPCRPDAFLAAIAPFRADLIIGVECMFAWYWLSDLCAKEQLSFLVGHALYMKAIHGGKAKNDQIDANRQEMDLAARFADKSVRQNASVNLAVINCLDEQIAALELYLSRTAKVDDVQTYHRLQTIPGVGKVLALVLLYEIHDVRRFATVGQFLSYCRLVRCQHESAGKVLGSGGRKIGNAHLRWVFGEAACLFLRSSERAKLWKQRQAKKRGEGKALAILAARLGRAVYHLWRKREAFDEDRFWQGSGVTAKA